jgi:cell division protein ZapD
MDKLIVYEQPLNERIRTFLRLEFLFKQLEHHTSGMTEWDVRSALNTLLDINDLLARTDIKNELSKELDRHSNILKALDKNPAVDSERLKIILNDINQYLLQLRDPTCQPGLALKQDELVSSVKQRNAILGGSCNFDLPMFHHWLNLPATDQNDHLERWQQDVLIIRKSVFLIINLIRNSSNPTTETAEKGFFQKSLEQNINCQMIRILLSRDLEYYPEISAGKHRFTVRFMKQVNTSVRPVQSDIDIQFKLHCCIL